MFVSSTGREKESTFCVQNMECVVYFSDAGLYDSSEHSILLVCTSTVESSLRSNVALLIR